MAKKYILGKEVFKLKSRVEKSPYGWSYTKYQCPFCKEWLSGHTRNSHFSSRAKKESIQKESRSIKNTPHLDFYIKNTHDVTKKEWNIIII